MKERKKHYFLFKTVFHRQFYANHRSSSIEEKKNTKQKKSKQKLCMCVEIK